MPNPGTLYTIGYGNRKPADFFALLPEGATVIDVRRSPQGWSPAYSLNALRNRLHKRYNSFPALGNAGTSRDHWEPVGTPAQIETLMGLLVGNLAAGISIILMCAEQDYARCHRRFIVTELVPRVPGVRVVHL